MYLVDDLDRQSSNRPSLCLSCYNGEAIGLADYLKDSRPL